MQGLLWRYLRETKASLKALWSVRRSTYKHLKPGTKEYARRAREEIRHYTEQFSRNDAAGQRSRQTLLEAVPAAWVEIQRRCWEPIRQATGNDLTGHLLARLQSRPKVAMLSLGSGPGGVELVLAREAPSAKYLCLDLNPAMLQMGESSAKAEGLPVCFQQADLNTVNLPKHQFDLVLCHASLHHVLELERLAQQINNAMRPGGELVVVDIITRSGYRMWPETRKVVHRIWQTVPDRYRLNHTAYPEKRIDQKIWQGDTRRFGMECLRSEDILPVLSRNFAPSLFFPLYTIARRFFDTMYGPNYDLERPLDLAILNWIWELDRHYLAHGLLRPEAFFAIYTPLTA
jgi:SAM-dependent methyltransferase